MLLLLGITKTSSHNASYLSFFSGSHSRTRLSHHHDLGLLDSISHPCKNILRLFARLFAISLNDSQSCLSLLTLGLHFTHLQYSLSFSDKPGVCQPWHFSVTMYFSDSPTGSEWSLAPFNSDIAFGSHIEVCHCSFYFGGSGMHKAWKTALGRHQHKSDLVTLLLTTPPGFSSFSKLFFLP